MIVQCLAVYCSNGQVFNSNMMDWLLHRGKKHLMAISPSCQIVTEMCCANSIGISKLLLNRKLC